MLRPTPKDWKAKNPPAEPGYFLKVVRLLSMAAALPEDHLFSSETQGWIESFMPGSRRPIRLCEDVLASVANRLANPAWLRWLEGHPTEARKIGQVVKRLHHRLHHLDTSNNQRIHSSLVARRLILIAAWGGETERADDVLVFLTTKRLPPPWDPSLPWEAGCPPENWAATESAVRRFLNDVAIFWSDIPPNPKKVRRPLSAIEDIESRAERGMSYSLHTEPGNRMRVYGKVPAPDYPNGEGDSSVSLARPQMRALASLGAYSSQLAPSHREVIPATRLISSIYADRGSLLQSRYPEHVRDAALCGLNVVLGIEAEDLMGFGIGTKPRFGPGWIAHGQVYLCVGGGWHREMLGRVTPQNIPLPVPEWLSQLLISTEKSYPGVGRFEDLYAKDPLGFYFRAAQHHSDADSRQVKFLHRPLIYAALINAAVPPPALALLLDRNVGPFRAESSYFTTSVEQLWQHATRIQSVLFAWAKTPQSWALPTNVDFQRRVGVVAPNLANAASLALKVIDGVSSANERHATIELGQSLLGKRPTLGKPVPCLIDDKMILFADKNHGGGRRLRFVPNSKAFQLRPGLWKK